MKNNKTLQIVRANPQDAEQLSRIAWAAKKHWGYPKEWMEEWRTTLRPEASYIEKNYVIKAEISGKIMAWGAFCFDPKKKRWEIDHLWVLPQAMRQGIGNMLWENMRGIAQERGIKEFYILSDPHAQKFYEKMGAIYVEDMPSTPKGRTLPLMRYESK